jgi:hypothetical protein
VIVESRQLDRGSPASEALDELGPFRVDLVAVRSDDEQAFELRVTNEMTDQLQRRAIGPVDVVESITDGRDARDAIVVAIASKRQYCAPSRPGLVIGLGGRLDQIGQEERQRRREYRPQGGIDRLDERPQDLGDRLISRRSAPDHSGR